MYNRKKVLFNNILETSEKLCDEVNRLKAIIDDEEERKKNAIKQVSNNRIEVDFAALQGLPPVPSMNIDNKIGIFDKSKNKEKSDMIEITETKVTRYEDISVSKKPRPDGYWCVKFKTPDGEWVPSYSKNRDEAIQKAIKARNNYAKNPCNMSFFKYINNYIEKYKKPNVSNNWYLELHRKAKIIHDYLGNIKLIDVTGDNLQEFLNSIKGKGSRKKYQTLLKSVFTKAQILGHIRINPVEATEVLASKDKHYPVIEVDMQDKVYNLLDPAHQRYYTFCINTGCRLSEALAVTYSDVDTKNMYIKINKKYTREKEIIPETKTSSSRRRIPILKELIDVIGTGKPGERIFNNISHKTITTHLKAAYKELNIEATPAHSLRHTFISNLYHVGVRDKYIQNWAGHSSITVTMDVYTHLMHKGDSKFIDYCLGLKKNFT